MALPDHDTMVSNILSTFARASDAQRHEGRNWYPFAGHVVTEMAAVTGTEPRRMAYALAALSPRNPWRWNVADAYCYAVARRDGLLEAPRATTFKRNQRAAWQALAQDTAPWSGAALKVNAFVAAILGDHDSVVVDTWAYRVATNVKPNTVRDADYRAIVAAYKAAAIITRESPASLQAVTWLVAQTEGLASLRKGRHDLTFKQGTPDFVLLLLDQ